MTAIKPKDKDGKEYKFKCTFSGTIADSMRRRSWSQTEADDWDIFWCDMVQFREVYSSYTHHHTQLRDTQRIGHFRNCQEISRKNMLVKNLKKLKSRLKRAFGPEESRKCAFFPRTFILPSEHPIFVNEFRAFPNTLWIIKPSAGAQGRGIFIFKTLKDYFDWMRSFDYDNNEDSANLSSDINVDKDIIEPQLPPMDHSQVPSSSIKTDTYVVQQYITNPYLIGGRKFDIRFYVLVTSITPLKVWTYREGFARFSTGQFSLDALQDVYIHLTNVAIQRTAEDYNPEKGSKWSLQSLREYMTARHGREKVHKMFGIIDNIVIRTLQSASGVITHDKHCFEVYGFDVIIDRDLFPWLLEVNSSPAFTPSNEEDYILKCGLIDDTVSVLDVEQRLTGLEKRVGGYDLLWDDGPVYANPSDSGHFTQTEDGPKLNSYLGCKNDRVPQLRDIHRNAHFLKATYQMSGEKDGYDEQGIGTVQKRKRIKDLRFRMPDF